MSNDQHKKKFINTLRAAHEESLRNSELWDKCETTTIYGQKYLDPEKCKLFGFDPILAQKREMEAIQRLPTLLKTRIAQVGRAQVFSEQMEAAPQQMRRKNRPSPLSEEAFSLTPSPPRPGSLDEQMSNAVALIGRRIRLMPNVPCLEVVSAKRTNDKVLLGVKDTSGNLDPREEIAEIPYEEGLAALEDDDDDWETDEEETLEVEIVPEVEDLDEVLEVMVAPELEPREGPNEEGFEIVDEEHAF